MDFNRNEVSRRRALEKALAAKAALEAKLAEAARAARSAKSRLLAATKSESWHRHSLAWHDRDAGYTGEMASARVYMRSLPIHDYIAALAPFADVNPDAQIIALEFAAVSANLADWTEKGDELLLERARREYVGEVASFRRWEAENPGKRGWREQPATRNQLFQISRNAARLGIEEPVRVNRGEAHDWIEAHGGNLRLVDKAVTPPVEASSTPPNADLTIPPEAVDERTLDVTPPVRAYATALPRTPMPGEAGAMHSSSNNIGQPNPSAAGLL